MSKSRTERDAVWPPTAEIARQAGHTPASPLKAIRAKCLDCSCYQISEVRLCEAVNRPLWPFRAAKHPWWDEGEITGQTDGVFEHQTAFENGRATQCIHEGRTG